MLWRIFFLSFVLKNNRRRNRNLLDSFTSELPIKLGRSYSNEFNFNINDGYDGRYNGTYNDDELLVNITHFNRKMNLLKTLENKNISKDSKVKLIEEYNINEIPSPILPNIHSGGLFKDWNWD
jgi:hypothetical protein